MDRDVPFDGELVLSNPYPPFQVPKIWAHDVVHSLEGDLKSPNQHQVPLYLQVQVDSTVHHVPFVHPSEVLLPCLVLPLVPQNRQIGHPQPGFSSGNLLSFQKPLYPQKLSNTTLRGETYEFVSPWEDPATFQGFPTLQRSQIPG